MTKQKRLTILSALIALIALLVTSVTTLAPAKADTAYVAEIVGGSQYETLQSAIDAATDGDTVKLLNNVTTPYTNNHGGGAADFAFVFQNKTLTIDLNGKTLAQAAPTNSSGLA